MFRCLNFLCCLAQIVHKTQPSTTGGFLLPTNAHGFGESSGIFKPFRQTPKQGPMQGKDFALLCIAWLELRDLGTPSSEYWPGCNKKTPILIFCMIGGNFAAMWQSIQPLGCLGILQRQFFLFQTKEWNSTILALELGSLNKLCPPNRMEQGLATLSVSGKYSYQIPLSVAHEMVVLLSVQ